MPGKKKKKATIARRKAQTNQKKQRKSKSRQSHSKSQPQIQHIVRPALSDIVAPEGFRTVSMSQAMMEYAKPVMNYVEDGTVSDPNVAMLIVQSFWNYDIPSDNENSDKIKNNILSLIRSALHLNKKESVELFEEMVQRKNYLLPHEIQPDKPLTMFIRKEEHYLIPDFDYSRLTFSKESVIPDDNDRKMVSAINYIDKYIADCEDYDEWEDHYFSMEEQCTERFHNWLTIKELHEFSENFPFCVKTFINFIYRYGQTGTGLKSVLPVEFEEFFLDYLLRKVITEPYEYVYWPPALKLFYTFLHEKEYIRNPESSIQSINMMEPELIKILRDRFS